MRGDRRDAGHRRPWSAGAWSRNLMVPVAALVRPVPLATSSQAATEITVTNPGCLAVAGR